MGEALRLGTVRGNIPCASAKAKRGRLDDGDLKGNPEHPGGALHLRALHIKVVDDEGEDLHGLGSQHARHGANEWDR